MTYEDEVLADSPRLYWHFNESAGNFGDASGNGNPDTATSGAGILYQQPPLLSFDLFSAGFTGDDSSYVWYSVNTSPWMDSHDAPAFSVEVSIQPAEGALTGEHAIVGRWYTDPDHPEDPSRQRWRLYVKDGVLKFNLRGQFGFYDGMDSVTGIDGPTLAAGTDSHVIVSFDGGTATMYVDGEVVGSCLQDMWFQNEHFVIGIDGDLVSRSWAGLIDEASYYTEALSEGRVAAHYATATGETPPAVPLTIAVPLVSESDETFIVDAVVPVVPVPLFIAVPLITESDSAPSMVREGFDTNPVRLGKAIESEEPQQLEPMVQLPSPITFPEEQEVSFPVTASLRRTGFQLGVATEREQVRNLRQQVVLLTGVVVTGTVQTVVLNGPTGAAVGVNTLVLDILEREPMQAPTSILVSVDGAIPNRRVNFVIDGVEVDHQTMPDGTGAALFSVPVPEAQGQRGEHVLSINQSGAVSASAIFTLQYDPDLLPTSIGPDAPPVDIPESHHPSGVRRWVLQDLMPGGLGSYVMPLNPSEMDNPSFERVLTAKHTTAVNEGQFHISEGAVRPLEWSFKGYCPTQEMAETLRAYAELKRRFYVIDHRGRAWIVVVTQGEIVPRLQEQNIYGELTDWVHDYTISAVIFDRAELD